MRSIISANVIIHRVSYYQSDCAEDNTCDSSSFAADVSSANTDNREYESEETRNKYDDVYSGDP